MNNFIGKEKSLPINFYYSIDNVIKERDYMECPVSRIYRTPLYSRGVQTEVHIANIHFVVIDPKVQYKILT